MNVFTLEILLGNSKPWFTVDLFKLLRKRNKLYRKYISNPTPFTHGVYKSYRNKYINSIRSAKKKNLRGVQRIFTEED